MKHQVSRGRVFIGAVLAVFGWQFSAPAAVPTYKITDLGTLGGNEGTAIGLNDNGDVVGVSQTAGGQYRPCLYSSNGTVTDLGTLPGGGGQGFAMEINNLGQIVGRAPVGGIDRAFLYFNGSMQDIGTLGGTSASAAMISENGKIVGYAKTAADATTHAFLYSGGVMKDLGSLGGVSECFDINEAGVIVGQAAVPGMGIRAFFYANGAMANMGTLNNGILSYASAINNSNVIVGSSQPAGAPSEHAFVYENSVMTDLGTLGGSTSFGQDINDAGVIVGSSQIAGDTDYHPFVYMDGAMHDLKPRIVNDTGWTLMYAQRINASGQISGYGMNPDGKNRGFLLTPVTAAPGNDNGAILKQIAALKKQLAKAKKIDDPTLRAKKIKQLKAKIKALQGQLA